MSPPLTNTGGGAKVDHPGVSGQHKCHPEPTGASGRRQKQWEVVSGVRAEEELVGLAAGVPLVVEVVSTYGSSRARRRATSVISCFITSSGKKWAIQFTNATHKSFVVNSPVTRRLRWESASARVSVVSTVALRSALASGISESRERIAVCNACSLRPGGRFDVTKSYSRSLSALTKPKPRWDVHMAGDGDLDWGYAGTPLPLIAGWSGSGA